MRIAIPRSYRSKSILLLVIMVVLVATGLTTWYFSQSRPVYGSLPPSSRPVQHVYVSDDGSVASVYPDQRLEFDVGDMREWGTPRISTGSHIVQLSSRTFASPISGDDGTITLTRRNCAQTRTACTLTIYVQVVDTSPGPPTITSEPAGTKWILHP